MIDLHMHTTNSDGTDTPLELLKKCEQEKLEYIAITDHDTCESYNYLNQIDVKKVFSGNIIIGCELTTTYEGRTIELLGYGVDPNVINEWAEGYYTEEKIIERKENTLKQILENLNKLGVKLTREQVNLKKSPDSSTYEALIQNREENEKILGKHILESRKTFFREGTSNPESKLYVDVSMYRPSIQEIADLIHRAGGKAFLAHAYQYAFSNTLELIDNIRKDIKLDGVEVYHSSFTKEQMKEIYEYAMRNNLFVSGGSDYHGTLKPEISLMTGCNNNLSIDKSILTWI